MLGIEVDMSFPDYRDLAQVLSYRATGTGTANEQLEYLASLRGRAGYAMGAWTPFVTGGIAWASTRYSRTDLTTGNEDANPSNIRLGYVLGGGYATEGEGLLAIRADGDGPERAIRHALDEAGLRPADVGMIVAHANGTRASDASEAAALLRVFGKEMPPVTGFKWAFGHLIAAAGIIEAAVALAALQANVVPGIAALRELDPECAGLAVSPSHQVPRSDVALVLCRGFAGTNAAVLIRAA